MRFAMRFYTSTLNVILFLLCTPFLIGTEPIHLNIPQKSQKLAVFTDYEADDSVGIALLLKHLRGHNIAENNFLFGTLLSNQYRKKSLVQEIVKLFGYNSNKVFAGSGDIKKPFEEEGRNILSSQTLEIYHQLDQKYLQSNDAKKQYDPELKNNFLKMLYESEPNSVDVLLLTNPIDFVKTVKTDETLLSKIRTIYMMGGWYNNKPTFNWNLNIKSVIQLLNMMKNIQQETKYPQLVLFSSHFFAREFNGYVNQDKFPEVIKEFDKSTSPIVNHLRHMIKNWDDSMTVIKDNHNEAEKKWRLEMVGRIGKENIGRQFAPADPATVLGYLYPDTFIQEKVPVKITLDITSKDHSTSQVNVEKNSTSNIFIVEKVDIKFFNDQLIELMKVS